jgi:hypothetical protein
LLAFLQDFVNFKKGRAKESAKRKGSDVNEGKFVLNIDFIFESVRWTSQKHLTGLTSTSYFKN